MAVKIDIIKLIVLNGELKTDGFFFTLNSEWGRLNVGSGWNQYTIFSVKCLLIYALCSIFPFSFSNCWQNNMEISIKICGLISSEII